AAGGNDLGGLGHLRAESLIEVGQLADDAAVFSVDCAVGVGGGSGPLITRRGGLQLGLQFAQDGAVVELLPGLRSPLTICRPSFIPQPKEAFDCTHDSHYRTAASYLDARITSARGR